MRIERHSGYPTNDQQYHKFQGASSQNEDWKWIPISCCNDWSRFQGASSQNEDWKAHRHPRISWYRLVSRCILAKWGLKAFSHAHTVTQREVSRCILAKWGLKVYKQTMFHLLFVVSRCILAKWGLKVSLANANAAVVFPTFQGASSQNEDWKPLIPAACPNSCLCFKALLAKWGLKDIILKSIYSFKKLLITLNWTMTDVLNFRMET